MSDIVEVRSQLTLGSAFGSPESRQDHCTPVALFKELERRYAYGGRFNLDVCCSPENCLVPDGLSAKPGWDALVDDWIAVSSFVNGPWGDLPPFLDRLLLQLWSGNTDLVCWLGPVRPSQPWWHKAKQHGRLVDILGRVDYYLDGERQKGIPLDSAVWLFERTIEASDFR